MIERKLPKVSHNTKVGYSSAELLLSTLGMVSNIYPIPTEKDLGIDMRAELLKGQSPIGQHYNVQCKGTEDVEINDTDISIQIKVTTINYWLQQKEPTFLIVVDREQQLFFWTYPYFQIKDRIEQIQNQKTVSIFVPKNSYFDTNIKELPEEMVDIIFNYESNNLENFAQTLKSLPINDGAINIRDPFFTKISGMHESITKIINTTKIIEETFNKLNLKLEESIEVEINKYRQVIIWLDHENAVKNYIKSNSVYDELGFVKNMTPREIIESVRKNVANFSQDKSTSNLDSLNESVLKLSELNINLSFFLREILYESNQYGDYDWLVSEYDLL